MLDSVVESVASSDKFSSSALELLKFVSAAKNRPQSRTKETIVIPASNSLSSRLARLSKTPLQNNLSQKLFCQRSRPVGRLL